MFCPSISAGEMKNLSGIAQRTKTDSIRNEANRVEVIEMPWTRTEGERRYPGQVLEARLKESQQTTRNMNKESIKE